MYKNILLRPLISEKAELQTAKFVKYSFVVDKRANKLEIKQAVEKMYNVTVTDVNTLIMPGKSVVRNGRSGVQKGRKSDFKKAIVTLSEGDEIDFFGDI